MPSSRPRACRPTHLVLSTMPARIRGCLFQTGPYQDDVVRGQISGLLPLQLAGLAHPGVALRRVEQREVFPRRQVLLRGLLHLCSRRLVCHMDRSAAIRCSAERRLRKPSRTASDRSSMGAAGAVGAVQHARMQYSSSSSSRDRTGTRMGSAPDPPLLQSEAPPRTPCAHTTALDICDEALDSRCGWHRPRPGHR